MLDQKMGKMGVDMDSKRETIRVKIEELKVLTSEKEAIVAKKKVEIEQAEALNEQVYLRLSAELQET